MYGVKFTNQQYIENIEKFQEKCEYFSLQQNVSQKREKQAYKNCTEFKMEPL